MRISVLPMGAATAMLAAAALSAQTYEMDRGVWVAGGSASFSHLDRATGGGTTTWQLYPRIGYFVIPGLVVDLSINYAHTSDPGVSSTSYGAGPGLAYYFLRRPSKLHPYVAATASWGRTEWDAADPAVVLTSQTYSAWFGSAGLALMVARNVAVTGDFYFGEVHADVLAGQDKTTRYGVRFGISVFLY